jgi:hypothetical protein
MFSMSVAIVRRPKRILRAADLPSLPSRLLVSIWEVSLPVASLFIAWGISIVVLCTQDICIDRLWMEVSLAGCYASIALGGIAYMIDLLILDSPNEPIRLDESILTRP